MNNAPDLVYVPTDNSPDGGTATALESSWRDQGRPPLYQHPQAVARYAIGSAVPLPQPVRFNGVGYE